MITELVLSLVLAVVVLGLAVNQASNTSRWPGPLEVVRRHPWPAIGVVLLVIIVVGVLLLLGRERARTSPLGLSKQELRIYTAGLTNRYRYLELNALAPIDDELRRSMSLQEVFVPQWCRTEVPPVDLPRDVRRRLLDEGELRKGDIPEPADERRLREKAQAWRQRPARPVLDIIGSPAGSRVVVLGDPGAGKSTLVRYVALELASGCRDGTLPNLKGWLPVLVEFRRWAPELAAGMTFTEIVAKLLVPEGGRLEPTAVDELLRERGRVIVLFDGLDELFQAKDREDAQHRIAAFAARFPKTRVVLTSRVIGYRPHILAGAGFSHQTLQDLDEKQIALFSSRWYDLAAPNSDDAMARKKRLLKAVKETPSVRELAGNPMLLTIMSLIGLRQELPRDRHSVYRHAATVLVARWDVERHLRDASLVLDVLEADKMELLRLVARRMQESRSGLGGNHIAGQDLITAFTMYLQSRYALERHEGEQAAEVMLQQFRSRNFILSHFGSQVYGFVHRGLLEYFAASEIVSRYQRHQLTITTLLSEIYGRHWRDPAWQEVLLLVTGIAEDPSLTGEVIEFLLRADPVHTDTLRESQHLLLATRCLGEARILGRLVPQAKALLAANITDLSRYSSEASLADAMATVGIRWPGRERYADWFVAMGQRVNSRGATLAATALLNDSSAMYGLLYRNASHNASSFTRANSLQGLVAGWPDDPGILGLVHNRAIHDPDGRVRRTAVAALASSWQDEEGTLDIIRDRAANDANWFVRRTAVEALASGWHDEPGTLALIRERAVSDPDVGVRHVAIEALTSGWHDEPRTLDIIRNCAASDSHAGVRSAAAIALGSGWPGDPHTLDLIHEHAASDRDWGVRQAAVAALALGWPGEPRTLSLIRDRAANDPDEDVRQMAVDVLASGWPDEPGTLGLIRDRVTADPDWGVRQAAVEALAAGWHNEPPTLRLIRDRVANDPDAGVRWVAIDVLVGNWAGEPDTLGLIRDRATNDTHGRVRQAAINALAAGWPDEPHTAGLVHDRAAADPDANVRRTAVGVLASRWPDEPATLELIRDHVTNDPDWLVRRAAVEAVAACWHREPATVELIRDKALNDPDRRVRQAAVETLAAGWPDEPATLHLIRALVNSTTDEDVRCVAVEALAAGWRDEPGTLDLIRDRATNDPAGRVRQATVGVLALGWRDERGILNDIRDRATDPDAGVRQTTVAALAAGWPDEPRTLDLIHDRATNDPDEGVRHAAVSVLAAGWPGEPGTVHLLRNHALQDSDAGVRQVAAEALVSRTGMGLVQAGARPKRAGSI